MDDLTELYQAIILDHNKHPRNCGALAEPTTFAEGFNPLCGDEVTVYLTVQDGIITDARFVGQGCAISKASASLMTVQLKGKSIAYAKQLAQTLYALLTDPQEPLPEQLETLGDLAALSGVRQFCARIKCATLAWHTLEAALDRA